MATPTTPARVLPISCSRDIIDVTRDAISALTPVTHARAVHFSPGLAIAELESIFDFFGIDYEPIGMEE